jgi:hypothetical protein
MSAKPQQFVDEFGRKILVTKHGRWFTARFADQYHKSAFAADPEMAFERLVLSTPPGWKPVSIREILRQKKGTSDETAT